MTAPRAYYNEHDAFAADWLRDLIARGLIAPGDVDERDIRDVQPDDLRGYTQCHFFAGIGGWSYALRLAGWPDDRPVWTGSCPCQPFSSAGQRRGVDDERHLWPEFRRLIGECGPATVFGEQVASKDGRAWLAAVRADLEALAYAVGGADLCAAGVGAPNIRQRLFWVADAVQPGRPEGRPGAGIGQAAGRGLAGGLAHADTHGRGARALPRVHDAEHHAEPCGGAGRLGVPTGIGCEGVGPQPEHGVIVQAIQSGTDLGHGGRPRAPHGFWRDADWLFCTDGRWRPVAPGSFPLAHGVPGRVGKLRGYGNAINPYVAAEFIAAYLEAAQEVCHGRCVAGVPDVLIDPELEYLLS